MQVTTKKNSRNTGRGYKLRFNQISSTSRCPKCLECFDRGDFTVIFKDIVECGNCGHGYIVFESRHKM